MNPKHIETVELIYGFELSESEQKDELDLIGSDYDNEYYFRYRGSLYGLYDFMRFDNPSEWDGYLTLTNTSGLVVKLDQEMQFITVGLVY